jgi:hypothetical protein
MRGGSFSDDIFHPILDLKLPLFQCDFFDLFGLGKVLLVGECVKASFEFVVLVGELVKLVVGSQQQFSELLIHAPPPDEKE